MLEGAFHNLTSCVLFPTANHGTSCSSCWRPKSPGGRGVDRGPGVALEKAKTEKEFHGEFESEHPGYCGAQDTFYVGNLKGVDRVYQQSRICSMNGCCPCSTSTMSSCSAC